MVAKKQPTAVKVKLPKTAGKLRPRGIRYTKAKAAIERQLEGLNVATPNGPGAPLTVTVSK